MTKLTLVYCVAGPLCDRKELSLSDGHLQYGIKVYQSQIQHLARIPAGCLFLEVTTRHNRRITCCLTSLGAQRSGEELLWKSTFELHICSYFIKKD